jgi:hypothetical protein
VTDPITADPTAATTRAIGVATAPPTPDPTLATIRAIQAEARSHVALVNSQLEVIAARIDGVTAMFSQRLDAMDKANDLLAADLRKVPTDLQVAITSVKELEAVKFLGIGDRFEQNERQTAREKAAADLALAAAFDAQKEAAAATNNANAEAIRKSELATAETIKTNAEAQRAGQQSLADKIDDAKDRMNRLETLIIGIQSNTSGGHDQRTDYRANVSVLIAVIAVIVSIALGVYAATGR